MKDQQWFNDRIGQQIMVTYPNGLTQKIKVLNEYHVPWLSRAAKEYNYKFSDVVISQPNVCIACEG